MNRGHELTTNKLRELLQAGAIDTAVFQKMHHRGTPPLQHLDYMVKVAGHNPTGPNAAVAGWIDQAWEDYFGVHEAARHDAQSAITSALSTQVGGDHYKSKAIQPVEYSEANGLLFLEGCIVKRATRHQDKSGAGIEDIKKIIHEAKLIAQLRYGVEL